MKGRRACTLYLSDDRQRVSRETDCVGSYGRYSRFARLSELRTTEHNGACLGSGKSVPRARGDHGTLFLSEGGKQVQNEGVNVWPKLGDNELHPLRHQAGNEVNIAAQAVELRYGDGTTATAGFGKCGGKLRASVCPGEAPIPKSAPPGGRDR
jgi:hypothetical protein